MFNKIIMWALGLIDAVIMITLIVRSLMHFYSGDEIMFLLCILVAGVWCISCSSGGTEKVVKRIGEE